MTIGKLKRAQQANREDSMTESTSMVRLTGDSLCETLGASLIALTHFTLEGERPDLQDIQLSVVGDWVRFVAADGFALGVLDVELPKESREKAAELLREPVQFHHSDILRIGLALGDATDTVTLLSLSLDDRDDTQSLVVRNGRAETRVWPSGRSKYPDWTTIVPEQTEMEQALVNPQFMRMICDLCAPIVALGGFMRFRTMREMGPMRVDCKLQEDQYLRAVGVVMPMVCDSPIEVSLGIEAGVQTNKEGSSEQ